MTRKVNIWPKMFTRLILAAAIAKHFVRDHGCHIKAIDELLHCACWKIEFRCPARSRHYLEHSPNLRAIVAIQVAKIPSDVPSSHEAEKIVRFHECEQSTQLRLRTDRIDSLVTGLLWEHNLLTPFQQSYDAHNNAPYSSKERATPVMCGSRYIYGALALQRIQLANWSRCWNWALRGKRPKLSRNRKRKSIWDDRMRDRALMNGRIAFTIRAAKVTSSSLIRGSLFSQKEYVLGRKSVGFLASQTKLASQMCSLLYKCRVRLS